MAGVRLVARDGGTSSPAEPLPPPPMPPLIDATSSVPLSPLNVPRGSCDNFDAEAGAEEASGGIGVLGSGMCATAESGCSTVLELLDGISDGGFKFEFGTAGSKRGTHFTAWWGGATLFLRPGEPRICLSDVMPISTLPGRYS